MELLGLLIQILTITSFGVFSPGPLTLGALALGGGWRSGIKLGLGHLGFELGYLYLMGLMVGYLPELQLRSLSGILGGSILIWMGSSSILNSRVPKMALMRGNPLMLGVVLSFSNPYLLIWWLGPGLKLIANSAEILGLSFSPLIVWGLHGWMDLGWCSGLAQFSKLGMDLMGSSKYRILILGLAGGIMMYGGMFLVDGVISMLELLTRG